MGLMTRLVCTLGVPPQAGRQSLTLGALSQLLEIDLTLDVDTNGLQ
jgi:hypothetical protein